MCDFAQGLGFYIERIASNAKKMNKIAWIYYFFSLFLTKYHFFYLTLQPQPLHYPNPIVRKDSHGLEKPQVRGCVLITKAFMRLVSKTSESRTFRTLAAKTTHRCPTDVTVYSINVLCPYDMSMGLAFSILYTSAWGYALFVLRV